MTDIQLITVPVAEYDPGGLDDAVLGDDFRICAAWYATLKASKRITKSEDEIRGYMRKIVEELVKRGKVTFGPAGMKPTSRELLADTLWDIYGQGGKGIYLVPPHARLIADGKKKLKLAQRAWKIDPSKFYGLMDGNTVIGMARFEPREEIDEEAFEKRRAEHRITRDELKAWGWKFPLSGWRVREFVEFAEPKPFNLPKGAQKFVNLSMECLLKVPEKVKAKGINDTRDIVPQSLEHLTNGELVMLMAWLQQEYEKGVQRGQENEDVVNAAAFVREEQQRRGMEIRMETPLDYAVERLRGKGRYPLPKHEESELHEIKDGSLVYLDEVLPYCRDFYTSKPHISIVGSLAIEGRGHDIDVLVRGTKRDRVLEFRLVKLFPPRLQERVRFVYDEDGPFTSYIPLYSAKMERLVGEIIPMMQAGPTAEIKRQAEKAKRQDKITFGEFFWPMKPLRGAYGEERQTVENFLKLFNEDDFPRNTSKKFDGMNVEVHVKPDTIMIISEDGEAYPSGSLPFVEEAFVDLVRGSDAKDAIFLAELEAWEGKTHLPREAVAGIVHSKEHDDSKVVANVYAVVWAGTEDLHGRDESERLEMLEGEFSWPQSTDSYPDVKKKLNRVPEYESRNKKELEEQVRRLSKLPASEGVVSRRVDSKYRLTGESIGREWVKYHKTESAVVEVVAREATKAKGAPYKYVYGLRYDPKTWTPNRKAVTGVDPDDKVWDRLIVLGRSFNWDKKLEPGDTFEIEFETMNVTERADGTADVSFWVPRPMKAGGRLETVDDAVGKARRQSILQRKRVTEEGETVYLSDGGDSLLHGRGAADPSSDSPSGLLQRLVKEPPMPDEAQKRISKWSGIARETLSKIKPGNLPKGFFVIEDHFRGRTVHLDFRRKENGFLRGYTILNQVAGSIKEDVDTLGEAKAWDSRFDDSDVNKFRPGMDSNKKVGAVAKAQQPLEWVTMVNRIVPAGTVGGSKEHEGVFWGADWGLLWPGVRKPWFEEFFLYGRRFKDKRLVFRLVRFEEAKGLEPGSNVLTWVAKEMLPYIMTRRARVEKREDAPPEGVSWLPPNWEAAVPSEMRWWEKKSLSKEKKMDLMDEAYDHFIETGVLSGRKIGEETASEYAVEEDLWSELSYEPDDEMEVAMLAEEQEIALMESGRMELSDPKFALTVHRWKGAEVVRGVWNMRWLLHVGDRTWELGGNPLREDTVTASPTHLISDPPRGTWFTFSGEVPAGKMKPVPPYPKTLPVFVDMTDSGDADVIHESDQFIHVDFKGRKLKGRWNFRAEEPGGDIWRFGKSSKVGEPKQGTS